MAQPSFDEFLAQAKPLNPEYSDAQIRAEYDRAFPVAETGNLGPPLDEFIKQAKPLNPDYSEEQIAEQYKLVYGEPPKPKGFGESFLGGMKQGGQELGASAAGTIERLQDPGDPLKRLAADAAQSFEIEAQKYAPSTELQQQPWYTRLRDPEFLGNLLGNVVVQSAPSLAGAAVGGVLGGPAGAAAGLVGVTYFQQAGQTYREAYERYTKEGLSEQEAHDKAYTTSGLAGLVSGVVNALAVPASLVAPFTSKLKNLALNYVANVAVDTGDQATQNILAKATYKPEQELTAGIPEAITGSALLSAPETIGTLKTFAPRPTIPQAPEKTPEPIAPILSAETTDEAIAHAQKAVEAAPITPEALDDFIASNTEQTRTSIDQSVLEATHAEDQKALEHIMSLGGEEGDLTFDERGASYYQGAPLAVISPSSLPDTTPPEGPLSKEKYDVLQALAGAMGKRIVFYEDRETLPHGVTLQSQYPTTIFMSNKVEGTDLFSVFAHEAIHLHEGTPFHEALRNAVWELRTPEQKELAIARHGNLPHDALLNEVVADIQGTELHKPEVWEKVYRLLQEKVGDEQAKVQVNGFIDTLKDLIGKIKTLIASRPWSTGFGKNKKTIAEQYVTDLTKVHDALAAGVADAIYNRKGSKPDTGKLTLKKPTESARTIFHPEAVEKFSALASAQRGAPESAMLEVQKLSPGVLAYAVEHTGDLIHRMTELSKHGMVNVPDVQTKVEKVLRTLTDPYGFEKEHHENLRNNARHDNQPVAELRAAVDAALLKYAAEHKKLPAYNEPQWLAREASVALGEQRFEDAVTHLKALKKLVSGKDFATRAAELTRDEKGRPSEFTNAPKSIPTVDKSEKKQTAEKKATIPAKSAEKAQEPDTEGKAKEAYDYASTQINLAPALAKKVLAIGEQIKSKDLAEKGREDRPHITVKYGLHAEDPKQARALLAGESPVTATIGALDFFETEDGDVIVLKVDSPALVALNDKITKGLENTTERAYVPHITVAYVKPGLGKGYVESLRNPLKGTIVTANAIHFSDKQGKMTEIPLGTPKPTLSKKVVALEHYSRTEGLNEIHPRFHGTGQIGAERRRMENEGSDYLPRSYFYRAGTVPERRFQGLTKYRATVPESRLIDLATLTGTPSERERAAKKAGYLGFYNSESSMPEAVALFEPVKTENRLTEKAQPRFAPRIWFSAMGNTLAQKMPANATKEQVRNILKSPGIKEDEVKWTGIQDYVDKQGEMVNKHNLLKWLEAHDVQVNEVVKTSGDSGLPEPMSIAEFNSRWNPNGTHQDFQVQITPTGENYEIHIRGHVLSSDNVLQRTSDEATQFDSWHAATEAAYEHLVAEPARQLLEERDYNEGATQYEGYKLPGGTDYTELLLTIPTRTDEREFDFSRPDYTGPTGRPGQNFISPHFDEPNILAHVRFDTRKDGAGKHVLFLEEVQSDWHEQGREKGYQTDKGISYVVKTNNGQFYSIENRPEQANDVAKRIGGRVEEQPTQPGGFPTRVPDAPFKTTWPELVMKRMLRWAAEHNYDRLAWTTGAQQNERYGLAKHVKSLIVLRTGGTDYTHYDLKAMLPEGGTRSLGHFVEERLHETVGKTLAEKIIANPKSQQLYEGLDLEVGGSGMKYFYDQMLPRFMEKYLKRFGTKVDALEVETENLWHGSYPYDFQSWLIGPGSQYTTRSDAEQRRAYDAYRAEDAEAVSKEPAYQMAKVHSIALTPEMKESVINQGQPKFARRVRPSPYPVEQPGTLDKIVRVLQDKTIDIKRIVEAIQKSGRSVPEGLNPVLAEEMFQKRDEQRARDFTNDELRPLIDLMRMYKITIKQLDDYLHARHVIDDQVNTRLQAINPDLSNSPNWDKLSGITDQEAQNILNNSNRPVMDQLARHVDDMIETTRELMVQYGLEKQSTIDDWRKQYKHYVPLRREGFDEQGHPTGTGKSVRGSTVMQRGGSGLEVEHILANIAQTRDQIVTRGEKNRVTVAMAGLLMLHPNPDLATLDKPATITYTNPATGLPATVPGNLTNYQVPTVRRFNPITGVMQTYPDPMYKGRDNVVNFRVKGEDYAIVFNEQNERAMESAIAFKNLGTPQLNGIMKAVAPYTRYLAAINTQYNPIFGIVNFVRDAQYAMLTLSSTPLNGKQAVVLKNAIASLAGIYQDARAVRQGRNATSMTSRLWQRFEHVGGPTGYRDLFFSATERAEELQRLMDPTSWKGAWKPQVLGKRVEETAMFKLLSDYNLTMENAIRLGVFKSGVDQGMSDLAAASLAKNITVNFNKKGQIGAQMGSLYAFFNANVQGSARILETLFDRTPTGVRISSVGKKIITGGLLVGVLQTFMLTMAGFDDDDPPEFVKQKNLVVPDPFHLFSEKGYGMVPMPLGFNLLPNVGRLAAEVVKNWIQGKPLDVMQKGASLLGSLYTTMSPTGGTGGLIQELSPTVVDPFAALATNKDWTGKAIAKEDHSSLDPTPGHTRAHDTATIWARVLSKAINWATGGTDYVPGVLSPTPDQIDYLVQQATGGVGREISKAAQVAQSAYTGEELPTHKIPLLGRFYGSATGSSAIRSQFYENVKQANMAYNEFEGRATHHEPFSEYIKTHPEARFAKVAIQVQDDLAILQKQKQRMLDQGASKDSIRLQEERITGLMKRFNTIVEKAQSAPPDQ